MSQGPRTAGDTVGQHPQTAIPMPQPPPPVDPRAQAVVNYVLEHQEQLCYAPNTTLVIHFNHQQVQAKITFQCEL